MAVKCDIKNNILMECISDMIQFDTVKEAIQESGINLTLQNDTSLLLWRDSLSHLIMYSKMQPWQIINRIPFSNILCRKVPLSIILKDGKALFPSYFDFLPETYILPDEFEKFQQKVIEIRQKALKEAKQSRKNKIKHIKNEKNDEKIEFNSIKLIKRKSKDDRSKSANFKYDINLQNDNKNCNNYKSEDQNDENEDDFEKKDEFLIKPSNGSLGKGIKIIQTGDLIDKYSYCDTLLKKQKNLKNAKNLTNLNEKNLPSSFNFKKVPNSKLVSAVAQKYIKSHLINNTKFDLRIYVLISSVDPFEIFVYRDGLARFCSLKSSCKSLFARITNVTMNKQSTFCNKPEKISRLISDVFNENFSEEQQKKIWSEIDDLIVLTLFCSHRYLVNGQQKFLPNLCKLNGKNSYSKCFQIFGFDILLRENDLKPFLIEINYRPSLEFMRNCERRMKVDMIKGAVKIAAPYEPFQRLINARKLAWSSSLWEEEVCLHNELFEQSHELKKEAINESKYERIWPFKSNEIKKNPEKFRIFVDILDRLDKISINDQVVHI